MTPQPASVRVATSKDEEAVYRLLCMAHEENGMCRMDEDRVRNHIKYAIERKGGVIGVIDGPTGLEGCLFMILSQWWYSTDWHLDEMCNFVRPDCRRSTHAKDLINFGKWFAEQMHMPLFIGVLSTHRTEAKVRLYQRQITHGGAVFFHNIEGNA